MSQADLSTSRGTRLGVGVGVALLHVAAVFALIQAFAPELTSQVAQNVLATFNVTVETPPPSPSPDPSPAPAKVPEPQGAAAPAGRKAVPKAVAAPQPKLVVADRPPAPKIAGIGDADSAGARDHGQGTGAGGQGAGTGAGGEGSGTGGGGGAAKATKIAGDINAARDYPAASREQRLGDYVIIALTVSVDGRARACRIHRPSRDPAADQITCRLAQQRFRFRPATNARGEPVESTYGWRQAWFPPR